MRRRAISCAAATTVDELFAIEREINGLLPQERLRVRNERSRPLMVALEARLREQRAKLSGQSNVSKAIAYCLTRWLALTRFLDDGRLCKSNNAAEREIRPIAVGRHNWTFAGSDEGGRRAAAVYTLIHTARINDVDLTPGSLTSSPACRITPLSALTSFCPGIGSASAYKRSLLNLRQIAHPRNPISRRPSPDAYA
jgi:hypothetical protein